jgi:hypothetical protein
MRSTILMLLTAWLLTACACGVPPLPEMPARVPPPHLVATSQYPPTLPTPATATGPALLESYVQAARLYHLLRAQYLSLIEWTATLADEPDHDPGGQ